MLKARWRFFIPYDKSEDPPSVAEGNWPSGDYLESPGDHLKGQAERLSHDAPAALRPTKDYVENAANAVDDTADSACSKQSIWCEHPP